MNSNIHKHSLQFEIPTNQKSKVTLTFSLRGQKLNAFNIGIGGSIGRGKSHSDALKPINNTLQVAINYS